MISGHHNARFDRGKLPVGMLQMLLAAPFIYMVIVPTVFLDILISLYQAVCFRLYGIPQVQRCNYVSFRRGRMKALNFFDRLNCHYCSYVNGVFAYACKIASETERMWCPIKHAMRMKLSPSQEARGFVENGDVHSRLEEYYRNYEESLKKKS